MQTTLILLKPDAVQRGLIGRIITRLEDKGLWLAGAKLVQVTEDLARRHYAEHVEKPFFGRLLEFITCGPVLALAVRGPQAVTVCRAMIGATNGLKATPGTIRGDYSLSPSFNLVHGSDSEESARRELAIWFASGELLDVGPRSSASWVDEEV